MRRRQPLRIPKAFSRPIIRVRSSTRISSAEVMLKKATTSMMTITTAAFTSWAFSQSKILAYRSRTLVTARFSESSASSYNSVRPSVRANVSAPASERVRIS